MTLEKKKQIEAIFLGLCRIKRVKYDSVKYTQNQEMFFKGVMSTLETDDIPPYWLVRLLSARPILEPYNL